MSGNWRESDLSEVDDSDEDFASADRNGGRRQLWSNADATYPVTKAEKIHVSAGRNGQAEWLSGSWPLRQFDESLPTNKRKAEWVRFRDQFERIVSCKPQVDAVTRLTGLKIFAGSYLLSIIEMQEKLLPRNGSDDIYSDTILELNKYFNQMCDSTKERMKFREMRMRVGEPFSDWVLRLEAQAKFCEFSVEQGKEELIQALTRRSIPEIAGKLYEMSDFFDNNLERIINHGKHLDYIKAESEEMRTESKVEAIVQQEEAKHAALRPVNAVQSTKVPFKQNRFVPYRPRSESVGKGYNRTWNNRNGGGSANVMNCGRCGRLHVPKQCKAFLARCHACDKVGHFAEFCRTPSKKPRTADSGRNDELKKEAAMINQVEIESSD